MLCSPRNSLLVVLLIAASTTACAMDVPLVDQALDSFLYFSQYKAPDAGYIATRVLDGASGLLLDSADVRLTPLHRELERWGMPGTGMKLAGEYRLSATAPGYDSVSLDTVRIYADSATLVDVHLFRSGSAHQSSAVIRCVTYDTLVGYPPGRIVGLVVNDSSGDPVAKVTLLIQPSGEMYRSDDSGRFAITFKAASDSIRLHIWHPEYDSIVVEFTKRFVYTEKPIVIHYQGRSSGRRHPKLRDQAVLIFSRETWSYTSLYRREDTTQIYHYVVNDGSSFGPVGAWVCNDRREFRLVRLFQDGTAWVHFKSSYGLMGRGFDDPTNFVVVSDSLSRLSNETPVGGLVVSFMLMPRGDVVGVPKHNQ